MATSAAEVFHPVGCEAITARVRYAQVARNGNRLVGRDEETLRRYRREDVAFRRGTERKTVDERTGGRVKRCDLQLIDSAEEPPTY